MYEIYLIIAVVQFVFGFFGLSYVLYTMLSVKAKCYLQLSEGLTTVSIGILYLIGYVLLSKGFLQEKPSSIMGGTLSINNKDEGYHLVENVNEARYIDNLNSIPSIIQTLLNAESYVHPTPNAYNKRNSTSFKRSMSSNATLTESNETTISSNICNYQENLLEHAMLVYSFVHGIMSLLNATYECKKLSNRNNETVINVKTQDEETANENEPSSPTISDKQRFIILLILLSWLLPLLSTSSLCMFTNCSKQDKTDDELTQLLKPLNVTTTNKTEVNTIVDRIYTIMKKASNVDEKPNNYSPMMQEIVKNLNSKSSRRSRILKGIMYDEHLKMHTFLVFVLLNFLAISYVNIECAKMTKCTYSKKLKLFLLLYIFNWSPATVETFSRVFIYDTKPYLLSNVFLAFGNANKILMNIIKWKDINKTNNMI